MAGVDTMQCQATGCWEPNALPKCIDENLLSTWSEVKGVQNILSTWGEVKGSQNLLSTWIEVKGGPGRGQNLLSTWSEVKEGHGVR